MRPNGPQMRPNAVSREAYEAVPASTLLPGSHKWPQMGSKWPQIDLKLTLNVAKLTLNGTLNVPYLSLFLASLGPVLR